MIIEDLSVKSKIVDILGDVVALQSWMLRGSGLCPFQSCSLFCRFLSPVPIGGLTVCWMLVYSHLNGLSLLIQERVTISIEVQSGAYL